MFGVELTTKLPLPSFFKIETDVLQFEVLRTARSISPSPFQSPLQMPWGEAPTPGVEVTVNVPPPEFVRMETLLDWKFATARSSFPSPFQSPETIAKGELP